MRRFKRPRTGVTDNMKELWGIMNILDNADDVALFVVSGRDGKLLYCNHLVSIRCNAHTGSDLTDVWDEADYRKAVARVEDGGVYRYQVERSRFGGRRNVTVCKVVWSGGILAYSFMLTAHVDDREEEEREKIFNILGRSYQDIFLLDMLNGEVTTLLKQSDDTEKSFRAVYYHPVRFDDWKNEIISDYAHPDDGEEIIKLLEPSKILSETDNGDYVFQYRKKNGDEYVWMVMRFLKVDELKEKVVCCERSARNENSSNQREMQNEVIMQSLSNAYRSVYLLDLKSGEYTTVKPDSLLFGIPQEGSLSVLQELVCELIPDEGQRNDYRSYFSLEALRESFAAGAENVGREYNSSVNADVGWMGANAFKPPYMEGMEDKCILTFMDITEHKRVEAERNEKNIIIDVLAKDYMCVFFLSLKDGSFHSVQIPQEYRYIEKQFKTSKEAFLHYAKAYVLEQYRDVFRLLADDDLKDKIEEYEKREYVYRTVSNKWIKLNIFPIKDKKGNIDEAVIAFEDYDDIMEQHELSLIYNATLLADYDVMCEYDTDGGFFFSLAFDGQRIIREEKWEGDDVRQFPVASTIHPDDMDMFALALSEETIEDSFKQGKTVSHMFLRDCRGSGEYRLFMYAFHYYEEMGKRRVLIMARDADREFL